MTVDKIRIVSKNDLLCVEDLYDLSVKNKTSSLKNLVDNLTSNYNLEETTVNYDKGYYGDSDRLWITETRLETDEEFAARKEFLATIEKNKKENAAKRRKDNKANEIETLKRLANKYKVKLDKEL